MKLIKFCKLSFDQIYRDEINKVMFDRKKLKMENE